MPGTGSARAAEAPVLRYVGYRWERRIFIIDVQDRLHAIGLAQSNRFLIIDRIARDDSSKNTGKFVT